MHGIKIDKVILAAQPEDLSTGTWYDVCRICGTLHIGHEILPERLISAESQGNAENVIIPHPGTVLRNTEDNLSIALNRPFWAIKRAIDFPVALSAANLLSPITLIVSALVLLDVGVPSSSGSSVWGAVERDSISISFAPYNLYSTDKPRQGARQHNLLRSGDSCKEHALMNCPSCTTFFQEIGL
jgi:hypothetical protein